MSATTARLYLDLLKKSLLGELHLENEVRLSYLRDCLAGDERFQLPTYLHIDLARPEVCEHFRRLMVEGRVREERLENLGFPDTMIGRLRPMTYVGSRDLVSAMILTISDASWTGKQLGMTPMTPRTRPTV